MRALLRVLLAGACLTATALATVAQEQTRSLTSVMDLLKQGFEVNDTMRLCSIFQLRPRAWPA